MRTSSAAMLALFLGVLSCPAGAGNDKPLTPVEAIKRVGELVTVQMQVRATKDRLEKHGEIYLDSEKDFRDAKNLGIVITKVGAARYKDAGVADPAEHFKDRTIRVTGKVIIKMDRPRIEVDEPKQIKILPKG